MFQNRVQGPCEPPTSVKDAKYVDQTTASFTRSAPMVLLTNTGKSKVKFKQQKLNYFYVM